VLDLFHASLARRGILGLGSKESLKLTPHEHEYEPLCGHEKLYRLLA
jgi:hypothetical protein